MIERVRPAQFTTTRVSGLRREVLHPIDQLGAGQSMPPGIDMLLNSGIGRESRITMSVLGVDQLLQVGGVDARRVVLVLDHLAERLAGHVDAGEDLAACRRARLSARLS